MPERHSGKSIFPLALNKYFVYPILVMANLRAGNDLSILLEIMEVTNIRLRAINPGDHMSLMTCISSENYTAMH